MQRILRGAALKNYREVLVSCSNLAKELVVDKWNLRKLTGLSAEAFWTWANTDTKGYGRHTFLDWDKCVDFERNYGWSWGNACEESTGAPTRTT